jgi:hypothetical protein
MHPATIPFVAGKYARKRITKQCQLASKQNTLSAFRILSSLPLKMGAWRILEGPLQPITLTKKLERSESNGTEPKDAMTTWESPPLDT